MGEKVTLASGQPVEVHPAAKQATIERDTFAALAGWDFEGDGEHRVPWDFDRVKRECVERQHEDADLTQSVPGNSGGVEEANLRGRAIEMIKTWDGLEEEGLPEKIASELERIGSMSTTTALRDCWNRAADVARRFTKAGGEN
jgi:hypothetical protein